MNKKTILENSILLALALAGASSCGYYKKDDKKHKKGSELQLTGRWKGDCVKKAFLTSDYQKDKYVFVPAMGFEKEIVQYTDEDCKDKQFQVNVEGKYEVKGRAKAVAGAENVNFTIEKITARPLTDAMAESLNKDAYCGVDDWKTGKDHNITGKECNTDQFKKGQVLKDIYKIEGKKLYLGKSMRFLEGLGITGEQRPEKLDRENSFARA